MTSSDAVQTPVPEALKRVFGHDVQLDAAGKPIEKGLGAVKQVLAGVEAMANHGPLIAERNDLFALVADLQAKLAAVQAVNAKLTADNTHLTEQLTAATAAKGPSGSVGLGTPVSAANSVENL